MLRRQPFPGHHARAMIHRGVKLNHTFLSQLQRGSHKTIQSGMFLHYLRDGAKVVELNTGQSEPGQLTRIEGDPEVDAITTGAKRLGCNGANE
jgi:hypothetical protein